MQLQTLLIPIQFELINLNRDGDIDQLNRLAYTYSDVAGLNFDPLSNTDFFARLAFACSNRWGLVIELVIEAFTRAKLAGSTTITINHFVDAFANLRGLDPSCSPFTAPDYEEMFNPERLFEMLNKSA
jgi:hypothetical protein